MDFDLTRVGDYKEGNGRTKSNIPRSDIKKWKRLTRNKHTASATAQPRSKVKRGREESYVNEDVGLE